MASRSSLINIKAFTAHFVFLPFFSFIFFVEIMVSGLHDCITIYAVLIAVVVEAYKLCTMSNVDQEYVFLFLFLSHSESCKISYLNENSISPPFSVSLY